MIIGAHSIIFSKNPVRDRKLLRDVFELPHVDVGDGWLIFGLPPSEVAFHPSDKNDLHEFYLMCEDIKVFTTAMKKRRVACTPVRDMGWGLLTQLTLPGGGSLGVYEPRHERPSAVATTSRAKLSKKRPAKRPTKRPTKRRVKATVSIRSKKMAKRNVTRRATAQRNLR